MRKIDVAATEAIRAGCKHSHWMWYVFPRLTGLGRSPTAEFYGIDSLDEARACLAYPALGPHLLEIVQAVVDPPVRSVAALFGSPDELTLHSSATLFAQVGDAGPVFERVLAKYFVGRPSYRAPSKLRQRDSGGMSQRGHR